MTARAFLDRRVRRIMGVILAGFAVFTMSILLSMVTQRGEVLFLAIVGFVPAFVVSYYAHFWGFRCPDCQANMAGLIMYRPRLSLDPRIHFCPYCGMNFDAVSDSEEVMQPMEPT